MKKTVTVIDKSALATNLIEQFNVVLNNTRSNFSGRHGSLVCDTLKKEFPQ